MTDDHETATIRAFVVAAKQERYLYLLARPKRRSSLLHALAGRGDLDPRFTREIRPADHTVPRIARVLRDRGAPESCYVISEQAKLDRHLLPLEDALQGVLGMGLGALLSCIPGQLGYFEGEMPGDRCLLERLSGAPPR